MPFFVSRDALDLARKLGFALAEKEAEKEYQRVRDILKRQAEDLQKVTEQRNNLLRDRNYTAPPNVRKLKLYAVKFYHSDHIQNISAACFEAKEVDRVRFFGQWDEEVAMFTGNIESVREVEFTNPTKGSK